MVQTDFAPREAGIDEYLTKPITIRDLKRVLEEINGYPQGP
jgi:hypothetical protein